MPGNPQGAINPWSYMAVRPSKAARDAIALRQCHPRHCPAGFVRVGAGGGKARAEAGPRRGRIARGVTIRPDANRPVHPSWPSPRRGHSGMERPTLSGTMRSREVWPDDGGPHAEVRSAARPWHVAAGEFQYDRHLELEDDFVGLVGELVRADLDDALGRLRPDRKGAGHTCERRRRERSQKNSSAAGSHSCVTPRRQAAR